ncbi:MAG: MFS transporter [Gammaproteobacteria bacterium]
MTMPKSRQPAGPVVTEIGSTSLADGSFIRREGGRVRTRAYVWYVLALIWGVMLFRFVDLQVISVLLESIRKEFQISDTQLGLLSGTAFALFYGTLGAPMGWLADRYNRRNLIAGCLGLWSIMTALCGLASGVGSLFLSRMAVGVGEAGGAPPSYSLISDYFPASRRSSIFAVLSSATPFGVAVGLLLGGWANAYLGWRWAFVAVAIPGVLLALLIQLTVREPVRGSADSTRPPPSPPFTQSLKHLLRIRSYRHLVLASSIFTMGAVGSGIWIASFFMRVHHMSPTAVVGWLAAIYGIGGILGTLAGGVFADRLSAWTGDRGWQARLPAITTIAILPIAFCVYLWPAPIMALLLHSGTTFLMHAWMGPTYGTIQSVAGANRRGTAAAVNQLTSNLIALGLGPLVVGLASDYLNGRFGSDSLRYSILAVVTVCYGWAAVHFLLASRTLQRDLETTEAEAARI